MAAAPQPEPVGVVRSTLRDRKNAPRSPGDGAPEGVLEIDERFAAALEGVSPGMELIAITWLHEGLRDVLQVHPGRDPGRPLAGVFATRSPDRPNPIGLHRVRIAEVDGLSVRVHDLEALDGTPVLDVKPVLGGAEER